MSGYTAELIAHQGVLEDDIEFLQNPFTVEALARRVREVMDQPIDRAGGVRVARVNAPGSANDGD